MKRLLVSLMFVLALTISCTKEDNIHLIVDDNRDTIPADTDSFAPCNYCVIGADTIQFTKVIKWKELSNRDNCRYDFFADNPRSGAVVLRFVNDSESLPNTTTSSYDDGLMGYINVNGTISHFDTCAITVNTNGRLYNIEFTGRTEDDIEVKFHYCDTVIDENIYTGSGYLTMDGDSVSLLQLSRQAPNQYLLCDPTDAYHFQPMRVTIKGVANSGSYDLAENTDIQVSVSTGLILTTGIRKYNLVEGTLQFSNNEGRYAVICHGSTAEGSVDFEYSGSCFDNTGNPISIDYLW